VGKRSDPWCDPELRIELCLDGLAIPAALHDVTHAIRPRELRAALRDRVRADAAWARSREPRTPARFVLDHGLPG